MSAPKMPAVHMVIHCFNNGYMIETHIPLPNGQIGPLPESQTVHEKLDELVDDLKERLADNEQARAALRLVHKGFKLGGEGAGLELPDGGKK